MKKIVYIAIILLVIFSTGGIKVMADKNIQMGQRNAENTDWDKHYPITKGENVLMVNGLTVEETLFNPNTYLTKITNMMRTGETVNIVCFGDSTTWGDNSVQIQVAHPYPQTLQARLRSLYGNNNITIDNKGYCGCKSDLAVQLFDGDIAPLNADLIILSFGINDISGYVPPTNTIDQYRANMIELVNKCFENDSKVILLTPTFTQMLNFSSSAIAEYGECVKEIALAYNIPCIDMHKAQEQLYQSGSQSISVGMVDGAHMTDIGYQLMADIILQEGLDPNSEKSLVIDDTDDKYVPVVGTKYIKTDCTGVHVSDAQYMKNCYTFKKDGSFGTYLSLEFYVNQAGMDLILFSPKATGGGALTVVDNGVSLPNVVNFYAEEQNCYDAPSIIAENLSPGYHKIEFKTANLVDGDATTDIANAFMYASYFMFTKNKLTALNSQDVSTTSDTSIEKFVPILNEKNSLSYSTGSTANATLLRTEKYCQTKSGKTLVIEFEGNLFDKCGVNWFGNKNTLGATYGFYLVFDTNGLIMYHSGINGSPAPFTNSSATVTLNYAIPHKVRIEHSFDGQIKVYVDGTLYITCTSKYSNSGYFGLYNRAVASSNKMTLTRFEYTYK